jgi:choline-sulfatase
MSAFRRRRFSKASLGLLVAGLLGCGVVLAEPGASGEERCNILFIMSDQHNAHALGCYGNSEVRTPNLDRLAKEGVRFENAFCQTGQCCPSRYTIFTGRYAHSHGLRWNGVRENLGETTIAEILRDAGYMTATIGKHHMKYSPAEHGFDHVVDTMEYNAFMKAEGQPHFRASGDWLPFDRKNLVGSVGTTHADNDHHFAGFWANEAIRFIRANKDRPFCLWLSFYGPHPPYVASKPWTELYDPERLTLPPNFRCLRTDIPRQLVSLHSMFEGLDEENFRQILAFYYAYVSQIDDNIGRVLTTLDELGLAERTVIVYTADHGDMMGEHGAFRKSVLCYDATVRVPLIIRLPGAVRPGQNVEELVGLVDLMPTLCQQTGHRPPENVQGESLVALLAGRKTGWRRVIFSEIGYPRPAYPVGVCRMARSHEYKYVHHENFGEPMEELFDLRSDPWETTNVVTDPEYDRILARMRREVENWYATTDHAPLYPIEHP